MSDVNTELATVWSELLKTDEVTADADFFANGGTSIVAVHFAALVQEKFGIAVDAIEVVAHPRFADIAALVQERVAAAA